MNRPTKREKDIANKAFNPWNTNCYHTRKEHEGIVSQALADYRVELAKIPLEEYEIPPPFGSLSPSKRYKNKHPYDIAKAIKEYGADS